MSPRALRGVALVPGSDCDGERVAAIYPPLVTAKLNDVAPRAWLADVLGRHHRSPGIASARLLPWKWRA
jgi:transposase